MLALLSIIGGALNRWRGHDVWPRSHTVKRGALSAATGSWAALWFDLALLSASVVAVGFYLGLLKGWAEWMDLGRIGGSAVRDFIGLTLRGALLMALPAVAVGVTEGALPAFAVAATGATMGLCYLAGWNAPSLPGGFLRKGPEWGETIYGTALWAGIALAGAL